MAKKQANSEKPDAVNADTAKVVRREPKTGAEMQAMRRSRNFWVLGLIVGLVVLFYLITIFRMAGAVS